VPRLLPFLFLLLAGPALAGDYADREFLGFSEDGRYFAFEEYGVQDGSGFPYSNIYFIDIDSDSWVDGTPIRLRIDTDGAPLHETRAEARDKAQPFLAKMGISRAGLLAASNPATETSADPHSVSFLPRLIVPPSGDGMTLRITESEMPAGICPDFGAPYKGFTLTLEDEAGETVTLHADDAIPASRRCPVGYAISDVVTFHPAGETAVLVVVLSVFSLGFEGPDRRFIAVSTRLNG